MSVTRLKIVVTFSAMLVLLFSSPAAMATVAGAGDSARPTVYDVDIPCCRKP